MDSHKVVMHVEQADGVNVVRQLPTEPVGQPSQARDVYLRIPAKPITIPG